MSRYFFYLRGASKGVNDLDGEEFADDVAALDHIVSSIRSMIEDGVRPDADFSTFMFEVRDQAGRLVSYVPFLEATAMSRGVNPARSTRCTADAGAPPAGRRSAS